MGLAQALALVPGVSRAGAALTAARLRGLDRPAAAALALQAALPVTAGRGRAQGLPAGPRAGRRDGAALAVGAGGALAGAAGRARFVPAAGGNRARMPRSPLYRVAFGGLALAVADAAHSAFPWRRRAKAP